MESSKTRRSYTPEQREAVVADVRTMGVNAAAKKHEVAQSCARRRQSRSRRIAHGSRAWGTIADRAALNRQAPIQLRSTPTHTPHSATVGPWGVSLSASRLSSRSWPAGSRRGRLLAAYGRQQASERRQRD